MGMIDWTRRGFLRAAPVAGVARLAGAQSSGAARPIVCRVIDSASGRPVPARVRLVDARGDELVPLDHSRELGDDAQEGDVRFQSRRYAYVDGEFRVDPRRLPAAASSPPRSPAGPRFPAAAGIAATIIFTTSPPKPAGWRWTPKI